jgi:hypothetical protein
MRMGLLRSKKVVAVTLAQVIVYYFVMVKYSK